MTRHTRSNAFVAFLAIVLALGCAWTARRSEAPGAAAVRSASLQRGEQVFSRNCRSCHAGPTDQVTVRADGRAIPAAMIALQVRQGIGRMPAFPVGAIDDASLTDLVDYLLAQRSQGAITAKSR